MIAHGPLCPKDFMGCCDDICRGSGCIEMDGQEMVYQCPECGEIESFPFDCDDEENYCLGNDDGYEVDDL